MQQEVLNKWNGHPVLIINIVQSVFSALSQGLEEDILESSIGLHGQ